MNDGGDGYLPHQRHGAGVLTGVDRPPKEGPAPLNRRKVLVDRRNWQPSSERLGRRAQQMVGDSLVVNISEDEQQMIDVGRIQAALYGIEAFGDALVEAGVDDDRIIRLYVKYWDFDETDATRELEERKLELSRG